MIWFIGAGCFHPDMLTLGAKKILETCDCILYDHLVNKEFLQYAKNDCECICVGKRGHQHSFPQEDIFSLLVEKDNEYAQVVRLKGGDPFLFARGSEEMRYVLEHGCNCQYIPGISSAIGALGFAGIPVTQRNTSTGFVVHTMHFQDGKDHLDYDAIAREKNTQIFFMGSHKIKELAQNCMDHGMPKDTPIALGSHLTYPSQKVLTSTLEEILQEDITPYTAPLLIVLGEVARNQELFDNTKRLSCFSKKALFCTIDEERFPLEDLTLKKGIYTYHRQVGHIEYTSSHDLLLDDHDILIFSSKHAVTGFFQYLNRKQIDIRSLSDKKIFCIGKKTENALCQRGLIVDHMEDHRNAMFASIDSKSRCLYIKEESVSCPLPSFSCYRIVANDFSLPEESMDALCVTSPKTLEILCAHGIDRKIDLFCFDHRSKEKAIDLGFQNIHPCPSSKEALIARMVEFFEESL